MNLALIFLIQNVENMGSCQFGLIDIGDEIAVVADGQPCEQNDVDHRKNIEKFNSCISHENSAYEEHETEGDEIDDLTQPEETSRNYCGASYFGLGSIEVPLVFMLDCILNSKGDYCSDIIQRFHDDKRGIFIGFVHLLHLAGSEFASDCTCGHDYGHGCD